MERLILYHRSDHKLVRDYLRWIMNVFQRDYETTRVLRVEKSYVLDTKKEFL